MRCQQIYYEADVGYLCWLDKQPCNKMDSHVCRRLIKLKENEYMDMYNKSHQRDTTAFQAIKNIELDAQTRYEQLIVDVHTIASRLGLRVVGSIRVRDVKTGQIYR